MACGKKLMEHCKESGLHWHAAESEMASRIENLMAYKLYEAKFDEQHQILPGTEVAPELDEKEEKKVKEEDEDDQKPSEKRARKDKTRGVWSPSPERDAGAGSSSQWLANSQAEVLKSVMDELQVAETKAQGLIGQLGKLRRTVRDAFDEFFDDA